MKRYLLAGCYATVGDILKVRSGYAFKRTDYQEHGTPLIRQSDIREAFVDMSQVKEFLPAL